MSFLAFYPWFTIDKTTVIGDYVLEPVDLNALKQSQKQLAIDTVNILSRFINKSNLNISSATIVYKKDTYPAKDLSDTEIDELFIFSEIVAFAALSERKFFQYEYVNRDNLRLVGQRFKNSADSPSITSRRRDGSTLSGYSKGVYNEKCPSNVSIVKNGKVDVNYATVLYNLYLSSNTIWENVYDAITSFNNANTDKSEMRESAEIVHLCGAFERIFGYSQQSVVPGFISYLSPIPNGTNIKISKIWGNYVLNQNVARNIREAWMKDFYKTRNEVGHGKSRAHHSETWKLEEHLLIGTYLFPVILKMYLEQNSLYTLSDKDRFKAYSFEYVLNTPHTHARVNPQDPNSSFWNDVISDAIWAYSSLIGCPPHTLI